MNGEKFIAIISDAASTGKIQLLTSILLIFVHPLYHQLFRSIDTMDVLEDEILAYSCTPIFKPCSHAKLEMFIHQTNICTLSST